MNLDGNGRKRLYATITQKYNSFKQTKDVIGLGLEEVDPLAKKITQKYFEKRYPIGYNQFRLSNKDIFEFFEEKGLLIDYYQSGGIKYKGTYTVKVKFLHSHLLTLLERNTGSISFPGLSSEYNALHKSIEKGLFFIEKLNRNLSHPEKRRGTSTNRIKFL